MHCSAATASHAGKKIAAASLNRPIPGLVRITNPSFASKYVSEMIVSERMAMPLSTTPLHGIPLADA